MSLAQTQRASLDIRNGNLTHYRLLPFGAVKAFDGTVVEADDELVATSVARTTFVLVTHYIIQDYKRFLDVGYIRLVASFLLLRIRSIRSNQ